MERNGATILGVEGPALSADEKRFYRDADPWGFILFARNLETPDQIRKLCDGLRDCVGRRAVILIDQEGGRVARLRAPHWLEWLPALEQMERAGPKTGPRAMWIRYRLIAEELSALGIDTNCAPIADIPSTGVHPIIRNRCYGTDVSSVVSAAREVARGLLDGGVLPVLKHIPGHGRPSADSHTDLPRTQAALDDLRATDFAAFAALSDLPMAMTAHVVYEALDPDHCATLSRDVIAYIRREIGFDGLLMTDDLSMSALGGSFRDRARGALAAGCDLVLHCNGEMAEMTAVVSAAGRLGEKAAAGADRALAQRRDPLPMDRSALLAELAEVLC